MTSHYEEEVELCADAGLSGMGELSFYRSGINKRCRDQLEPAMEICNFLNETLNVTVLALTYGPAGQDGTMQRLTVEYDITDAVVMTGGVVLYQSGDLSEMQNIGDNDRVYLEVKYSL